MQEGKVPLFARKLAMVPPHQGHIPKDGGGGAVTMPPLPTGLSEQSRKRCPPGSGAHQGASAMKRSRPTGR